MNFVIYIIAATTYCVYRKWYIFHGRHPHLLTPVFLRNESISSEA